MKTQTATKKTNIQHLREWFRPLVKYQMNPLWNTDPLRHRANRPKILGDETDHEREINDKVCAQWLARNK